MPMYTVVDSRQVKTLTQAGTMKPVYRVWIATENGATGQVDVAPSKWNKEDLAEILTAFAEKLDLAFTIGAE